MLFLHPSQEYSQAANKAATTAATAALHAAGVASGQLPYSWRVEWDHEWKLHFWIAPNGVSQWEAPTPQQMEMAAAAEKVAHEVMLLAQQDAEATMDYKDHRTNTSSTKRAPPGSTSFQNKEARRGWGRVLGDVLESVDEEVASTNSEVDAALAEIRERAKKQGKADRHL